MEMLIHFKLNNISRLDFRATVPSNVLLYYVALYTSSVVNYSVDLTVKRPYRVKLLASF